MDAKVAARGHPKLDKDDLKPWRKAHAEILAKYFRWLNAGKDLPNFSKLDAPSFLIEGDSCWRACGPSQFNAMLNNSDSRSIPQYLIGHCKKPLAASAAWREATKQNTPCYCEERSDEAIQCPKIFSDMDCFAVLAMTSSISRVFMWNRNKLDMLIHVLFFWIASSLCSSQRHRSLWKF